MRINPLRWLKVGAGVPMQGRHFEPTTLGLMITPDSPLPLIDDLNSRLAAESIFVSQGSDEGLVPCYSLLSEILEHTVAGDGLHEGLQPLFNALDNLLNEAAPFDDAAITVLQTTVAWLPGAIAAMRDGKTPDVMEGAATTAEAPAAEPEPAITTESIMAELTKTALKPAAAVTPAPAPPPVPVAPAPAAPAPVEAAAETGPAEEMLDLNLEENRELLTEFHAEALDHLQQIESALLVLDGSPGDRDALNGLFRSFHTLKGVAGFLRLTPMNRLAHEVESLLDLARTDKLRLTSPIITEILRSQDALAAMVTQITQALEQGHLPDRIVPVGQLITHVRALAHPDVEGANTPVVPCEIHAMETVGPTATVPAPVVDSPVIKAAASSSVRVNTEKLDSLVDVVGELVIVQSQLQESAKGLDVDGSPLARNLGQLGRITKDLQLTAMSLRMVPIKPTFQRMERLVRDLSREFGKDVAFETMGEETEIDRTVVEEIVDPLVHMVRNSLDHGLESPDQRRESGKAAQGTMRLAAYHEGSNLVIELSDDGRGINTTRVLAKARENGLVPPDANPTPDEIVELIFHPGFSTAEKVTAVSGRGVGMDVVRRNIERLRGNIEVTSEMGKGTTFLVRLPLTTAIIDGLLVRVGSERFILPAIMVQVAVRPTKKSLTTIQGSGEVLNHRGRLLPLHRLHRRFQIEEGVQDPTEGIVVIVESTNGTYALLVDELLNKQEVVIKNLGAYLQNLPGVAGGAILGDGTIALILDPANLAAAA